MPWEREEEDSLVEGEAEFLEKEGITGSLREGRGRSPGGGGEQCLKGREKQNSLVWGGGTGTQTLRRGWCRISWRRNC
jgi:hypothetical protein